ncbi:MAG: helix-turn-helix domain-containing protein, partial [Bacteroidetes bacterium]
MSENLERDFKGIWIPANIWLSKELNITEKVILAEIDSLDNSIGCFASNAYLSNFFSLSKSRISEIIHNLEKKGYIKLYIEKRLEHEGFKTHRVIKINKEKYYPSENRTDPSEYRITPSENSEYNNTYNN